MTNAQLTAYLQDDSYLFAVSYEELKTLVMQYPYATNLRILLLKKSFLEQNKDYDRNLQMAATYSTNRKYLYQVVQKVKSFQAAPQSVILGEDYLELTELSNIEKLLAEKQVADALGENSRFDTLAADWTLEFGNLETAEEAATEPKIKGVDEEEIEMFELAFNAQIAENQPINDEDDLSFLIHNLVSEFEETPETGPSVKTDTEAENLAFELINDYTAQTINPENEVAEDAFDLTHINAEKPVKTVLNLSELLAENAHKIAINKPLIIEENKAEIDGEKEAFNEEINNEFNAEINKEITEEEMDALLSNSFKSIVKEAPDDLMATSFAVFKGENPDALDDNLAYSFIDEKELALINTPINNDVKNETHEEINTAIHHENNDEIDAKIVEADLAKKQLELIEAELDKALTDKTLNIQEIDNIPSASIDKSAELNVIKPSIRKVIPNEITEKELANKAAIRLEKEITREAPSHSFRVIKKEIAREVAANSFKVVVKDKVKSIDEFDVIDVIDTNATNKANLIEEIESIKDNNLDINSINKANLIEEIVAINDAQLIDNNAVNNVHLIEEIELINNGNLDINSINKANLVEEIELIKDNNLDINSVNKANLVEEIELIKNNNLDINSVNKANLVEEIELIKEVKFEDNKTNLIEHIETLPNLETQLALSQPPQYIRDLSDIAPVFREKNEREDTIFEKNKTPENLKSTPQYKDELDRILSAFDKKTDDGNDKMTAKKSDLELEILNGHKVNIGAKPTVEAPPDSLSFTEWLRQYRMNQAAEAAKIATYEEELKERDNSPEVVDNQSFIEREDNRKSIKQNLNALFETDNDVPEHLFGFIEPTEKKAEKTLNTEGAADLIRQHLTTEISDEDAAPTEKKKKKKKKEMHELAARSIAEDAEMMSETLADLLVWQGKTGKAIDMYEKLSLAFPDKRTYFAAKIETIKSNAA
jgi:hypothetical protein